MTPRDSELEGGDGADRPTAPSPEAVAAGHVRLRAIAAILVAEAVGLAAFVVYLTVNLLIGSEETTSTTNTIIETVAFAAIAALLVLLARGALRAARWSRAPILVTQFITLLGPGINILQGDLWYRFVLGIPVSVAGAAAVLLTLTPSVTAAMDDAEL